MWPAAHAYAQHIINIRASSREDNLTPFERAYGEKADISAWHVYGTPVGSPRGATDSLTRVYPTKAGPDRLCFS